MALEYVLYDGEAKTGTARGAGAARIDAVKPLRQAGDMFRRDAHSGVGYREMGALIVHPPSHIDRALRRRVLRCVVDEVGERRVDFGLVADEVRVGVDDGVDVLG